jgi:phosphonate transport system substrate-binding protein
MRRFELTTKLQHVAVQRQSKTTASNLLPTFFARHCLRPPMYPTRRALLAMAALLTTCLLSCADNRTDVDKGGTSDTLVLRFSAIPDQSKTELDDKFNALASYLSKELGVAVQYVATNDYKASVEAFKNGDILLAWFGGLTGVQARHAVTGAHAIAQGKSDPKFKTYFIVHKKTGLTRSDEFPTELANRSFAFGSESSTSGRLMPEYFIQKRTGKSPEEFFGSPPLFSGSHDKTIELVESGQIEAGAVNFKVYDQRVADGRTDPQTCRVVWETPSYADYNFTVHPDVERQFGTGFSEKLQAVLLSIDDPELLSAFPREMLIEASNEDFKGIEEVARELGFLR